MRKPDDPEGWNRTVAAKAAKKAKGKGLPLVVQDLSLMNWYVFPCFYCFPFRFFFPNGID